MYRILINVQNLNNKQRLGVYFTDNKDIIKRKTA